MNDPIDFSDPNYDGLQRFVDRLSTSATKSPIEAGEEAAIAATNGLKPCPFCGGAPTWWTEFTPTLFCTCLAGPHIEAPTRESSAKIWNTRYIDPIIQDLINTARRQCRLFVGQHRRLLDHIAAIEAELAAARERIAALERALDWYAMEAKAIAKNMTAGNVNALEASRTVLAIDGGKRAAIALGKEQP